MSEVTRLWSEYEARRDEANAALGEMTAATIKLDTAKDAALKAYQAWQAAKDAEEYQTFLAEQAKKEEEKVSEQVTLSLETLEPNLDPVTEYVALTKRRRELEQADPDLKRKAFSAETRHLFVQHPILSRFSWTQESEYFNDGEPTPFRSAHTYPDIYGPGDKEYDDWRAEQNNTPELVAAAKAVKEFMKGYSSGDMMAIWGEENRRVTVSRDGVEVEQYDNY